MSGNRRITSRVQIERIKPSRKVLYHFAIFTIINEILIKKDRPIRASRSAWRSSGRGVFQRTMAMYERCITLKSCRSREVIRLLPDTLERSLQTKKKAVGRNICIDERYNGHCNNEKNGNLCVILSESTKINSTNRVAQREHKKVPGCILSGCSFFATCSLKTKLQPISQCLKATKNSMMTAIFVMAAAAAVVVDHVVISVASVWMILLKEFSIDLLSPAINQSQSICHRLCFLRHHRLTMQLYLATLLLLNLKKSIPSY